MKFGKKSKDEPEETEEKQTPYKKRPVSDERDEDGGGSSEPGGWAMTDPSAYKEAAKQSRARKGNVLLVRDGEKITVRFRCKDPIASFERYRMQVDGKYRYFTRPDPEKGEDVLGEAGLRPSRAYLYEVIDRTGYIAKKGPNEGKRVKNIARFYLVGSKQYESLCSLAEEFGHPLTAFDITIIRSGTGTKTQYTYVPKSVESLPEELKQLERIAPTWVEEFAPLPVQELRRIIARKGGTVSDENDNG